MTIGVAMSSYFQKLKKLYINEFNTAPLFPWDESATHGLFISPPDEEGYAQWAPKLAAPLPKSVTSSLCSELVAYYSSWYFLQLRGRISNMDINFLPFSTAAEAATAAQGAIEDGLEYFPNERCALLASCSIDGVDDVLLFYDQNTGRLFIYDQDRQERRTIKATLSELISSMEAVF